MKEQQLQVYLKEYDMLVAEKRVWFSANDPKLTAAFTACIGLAGAAIGTGIHTLFLVIPFIVVFLAFILLLQLDAIILLDAQLGTLEEKINALLEAPTLTFHSRTVIALFDRPSCRDPITGKTRISRSLMYGGLVAGAMICGAVGVSYYALTEFAARNPSGALVYSAVLFVAVVSFCILFFKIGSSKQFYINVITNNLPTSAETLNGRLESDKAFRNTHRAIGLVMLLPLLGWAITGFVFFIKPGYEGAYELLQPKTYPLDRPLTITPAPAWLEVKYFRTVLGDHLIVRTAQGWQHLDPATLSLRKNPTDDEISRLLMDAFSTNPGRYGQISAISGNVATTSTNVRVTLDWNRLSLQQRGRDTDRIDRLYKIHYLQWTGVKWFDRVLGVVGLALVAILSVLGLLLWFNSVRYRER